MKDSRIKSLTESIFNILVWFWVAFITNIFVLPLFGMPFNYINFWLIWIIYTVVSLIRSYLIRRIFVNGFYEFITK